jgi:hypothetical protein
VGGLGDEGPDQIRYRVGEEGEHGVGVPPMPGRHAEGVDLRRCQFDRAVTTRDTARAVSQDNVEEVSPMATSFKTDIVPLFTSVDIEHMSRLEVPLDDYAYMSQPDNAAGVYQQVSNGTMPPSASGEQPWSEDKVQLFKQWMDGGYAP